MTTPSDLILSALRKNRVIAAGDPLPGTDADDGLIVFNRMMHGLKAKKVDLGWTDLGLDDTIPLDQQFEESILFLLAVALAPEYTTELTPEVAIRSAEALPTLQAHFGRAPLLQAPEGTLSRVDRYYGWNINNG